jgi:DNA-binding CsgD family transcriptional regulator/PAS domain-containing protein
MPPTLAELPESDLRVALRALQALAEQSTGSAPFVDAALEVLTGIVASDLTTLSICDLNQGSRRVIGRKAESLSAADRAAFDRHFREHPLVRFHSSHPGGPTQRISDCLNVNSFRNSELHADYYRRIGINYVMALPLRIDSAHVISVVFNRSHADFGDNERAVLDAVRQPLAAIYRNLVACEDAGIGLKCISQLAAGGGWQMMRLTLAGRIVDASPAARRLLGRFFPEYTDDRQAELPPRLFSWFARSRNWGLERPAIDHGQQFTLSRLGSRLTVYFVPDPDDTSAGYLLMKDDRLDVRTTHLSELPVTERERAVLALVAAGKTNAEIAMLLAISARTVQKHLEHIFQKLGVETRTAAAVHALAAADDYVTTRA